MNWAQKSIAPAPLGIEPNITVKPWPESMKIAISLSASLSLSGHARYKNGKPKFQNAHLWI
jgi:hypothetical protein